MINKVIFLEKLSNSSIYPYEVKIVKKSPRNALIENRVVITKYFSSHFIEGDPIEGEAFLEKCANQLQAFNFL